MWRLLGVLGLVAIVGVAAFGRPGASPRVAHALSCENFVLQAAAQAFLKAMDVDEDQLDGPNDNGIACEELPCPCDNEAVEKFIGDAPTPTPTNTATNTPTQATSGQQGSASSTATPTLGSSSVAATATSMAVTATTVALSGAPPATVAPALTVQSVITPPSTGDGGLR